MSSTPSRIVYNENASVALKAYDQQIKGLVTSLPDISEIIEVDTEEEYNLWFLTKAAFIISCLHPDGVAIFYQTDRKKDGHLVTKDALVYSACGLIHEPAKVLWHKICTTTPPGKTNLYRPGYTHMIAVTRSKKLTSGKPTPDVIPAGDKVYPNGMGINAAKIAIKFCQDVAKAEVIYDPMCGQGTVLAVANQMGLASVGIDIDTDQCEKAKVLSLT